MGVLAVVAGAQLLRLDVETVLADLAGGGGRGGRGALSTPGRAARVAVRRSVRAAGHRGRPVAVVRRQSGEARGVTVQREVLVELVDVEGLDVADDVGAELGDVHVAEVYVLPVAVDKTAAFVFEVRLGSVVQVCFGGSGRSRWSMSLSYRKQ